jgi:tetratricopeptide (TPR) repeat protein
LQAPNAVLKLLPDDGYALREIAQIYYTAGQYDKSKQVDLQIAELEPRDFAAEYTAGVLDWQIAYNATWDKLAPQNRNPYHSFNAASPAACKAIAALDAPLLTDALLHLNRALALNPGWSYALGYEKVVYILRAGTHCGDAAARQADLATAKALDDKIQRARLNEGQHGSVDSPQPPSTLELPKDLTENLDYILPPPPTAPPPPPPPPGGN